MFGFKPMITGSPVTISSNGLEPMRFDSMSKASTFSGISYATFYMLKGIPDLEFALMEKNMSLNLSLVKLPHSTFKRQSLCI